MLATVKEWYSDVYGEQEAEGIPAELTWNALLGVLTTPGVQEPVLSTKARERCIRELARICRINVDILYSMIKEVHG